MNVGMEMSSLQFHKDISINHGNVNTLMDAQILTHSHWMGLPFLGGGSTVNGHSIDH